MVLCGASAFNGRNGHHPKMISAASSFNVSKCFPTQKENNDAKTGQGRRTESGKTYCQPANGILKDRYKTLQCLRAKQFSRGRLTGKESYTICFIPSWLPFLLCHHRRAPQSPEDLPTDVILGSVFRRRKFVKVFRAMKKEKKKTSHKFQLRLMPRVQLLAPGCGIAGKFTVLTVKNLPASDTAQNLALRFWPKNQNEGLLGDSKARNTMRLQTLCAQLHLG